MKEEKEKDNTGLYVGIGVGLALLGVGTYYFREDLFGGGKKTPIIEEKKVDNSAVVNPLDRIKNNENPYVNNNTGGGGYTKSSTERTKEIQKALQSVKYYNGSIDGNWNTATNSAYSKALNTFSLSPITNQASHDAFVQAVQKRAANGTNVVQNLIDDQKSNINSYSYLWNNDVQNKSIASLSDAEFADRLAQSIVSASVSADTKILLLSIKNQAHLDRIKSNYKAIAPKYRDVVLGQAEQVAKYTVYGFLYETITGKDVNLGAALTGDLFEDLKGETNFSPYEINDDWKKKGIKDRLYTSSASGINILNGLMLV